MQNFIHSQPYYEFFRRQPLQSMYHHPYHPQGVPFTHMNPYQQSSTYFYHSAVSQKPTVQVEDILQNPLQPINNSNHGNPMYPMYHHPYPKQPYTKKTPVGANSVLSSFKNKDGSIDMNKMLDTAGMMLNAVNQVSSLVKGVGGFFKV